MRFIIGFLVLVSPATAEMVQPSAEDTAFARDLLERYQSASFVHNVEYCGFILRDAQGALFSTPASRGDEASCDIPEPKQAGEVIASWHTHAGFNPSTYSEVPSAQDLQSDIDTGTYGWVSTPGGRFWLVDNIAREVRLICGPSCLSTDPNHMYGIEGLIPEWISLSELERWGE